MIAKLGSCAVTIMLGAAATLAHGVPVRVDAQALAPIAQTAGRDLYRIVFRGGEPAEVEIETPGGERLALAVFDASRRIVCRAADVSAVQRCRWDPAATGPFWIEVRNPTGTSVPYEIRTN